MDHKQVCNLIRTDRPAIDFQSPAAPMQLAWRWLAMECWSARRFDLTADEVRFHFSHQLTKTWQHVHMVRRNQQRRARAEKMFANELASLRRERALLQNKSGRLHIAAMELKIDQKISNLIANA